MVFDDLSLVQHIKLDIADDLVAWELDFIGILLIILFFFFFSFFFEYNALGLVDELFALRYQR